MHRTDDGVPTRAGVGAVDDVDRVGLLAHTPTRAAGSHGSRGYLSDAPRVSVRWMVRRPGSFVCAIERTGESRGAYAAAWPRSVANAGGACPVGLRSPAQTRAVKVGDGAMPNSARRSVA